MYKGGIDDLICRSDKYHAIKKISISESAERRWARNGGRDHSFDLQAIIIGKTGYGKSTTINSLFGMDIAETSQNSACTRCVQSFEFMINPRNYLSIADFPGIGESTVRDVEYFKLYKKIESRSDAIIYLLRADTRDYSADISVVNDLFTERATREKIIFCLNYCDKIEPISRRGFDSPSRQQEENIFRKINEIKNIFNPRNDVIPYSATCGWNLDLLHAGLINVLLSSRYVLRG